MADFMDKIKTGFNKGVATVSTGSKNMLEKTKLSALIKNLENEIKEISSVIGTKLYNWCALNSEGDVPREEFMELCREIAVRNEEIKKHKARIEELDAQINQVMGSAPSFVSGSCSCGQSNPAGSRFCAGCGKPLI